ncbi:MAG TPA: four helix bundle protein, partial [Candidatus Baltobacteraceae bacterium]|nr:four helix bundle protein [Candidatus Baltobacteraceae bacterium]
MAQPLLALEKAHAVVLKTYRLTSLFPADEKYGLVSQMRRAAVSISANLAEGTRRRTSKDR